MPRRRIVLLVERDPVTCDAYEQALRARGFQVGRALDGGTALELARQTLPGVIVGDFPIDLPGGMAFTAVLREDERFRKAIIITVTDRILTEKDSPDWMQSDRVLAKPIDPERLADEVAWAVESLRPTGV